MEGRNGGGPSYDDVGHAEVPRLTHSWPIKRKNLRKTLRISSYSPLSPQSAAKQHKLLAPGAMGLSSVSHYLRDIGFL